MRGEHERKVNWSAAYPDYLRRGLQTQQTELLPRKGKMQKCYIHTSYGRQLCEVLCITKMNL